MHWLEHAYNIWAERVQQAEAKQITTSVFCCFRTKVPKDLIVTISKSNVQKGDNKAAEGYIHN